MKSVALGIHHVAIQARDLERVAAFYRDVLGLAELRRWHTPDGSLRSIWLGCGEGFVAIEHAGQGALPSSQEFRDPAPGLHVVALRIDRDERDRIEAVLERIGAPVVHRTRWSIFVRDPEGNRVGLTHYPDEHQPES